MINSVFVKIYWEKKQKRCLIGDVPITYANIDKAKELQYNPVISIEKEFRND